MITNKITAKGYVFIVTSRGEELPFDKWHTTNDLIYYYPLSRLVDNGFATVDGACCLVPFESIYELDEDERILLGIPPLYGKAMLLRAVGLLNQPSFKYKVNFLTHVPYGDILPFQGRQGNIVALAGQNCLLSLEQYQLLRAVDEYNDLSPSAKTTEENMRRYATIKLLASNAGCKLDNYLNNESILMPEKVKIEIQMDGEEYAIEPNIVDTGEPKFTEAFERLRQVPAVYAIQNEAGERTRVVLNERQRSALEQLKRQGTRGKTKEQMRHIVENAIEYFDPDLFDLSEFYSGRVIEIGVYKPKFYPFISPYKSDWVAGATVETPDNGTTEFQIKTETELEQLEDAINQAVEEKRPVVNIYDTFIDIHDAQTLADIARRQFAQSGKPLKDVQVREVLIIEENTEEVGFSVTPREIPVESHYTLYRNIALSTDFKLKSHQEEGVAWLQHLFNIKANGCLIADDMGLGKTLQVLYFIDWHSRQHPNHKPYIIIAPVTLLENWENEYQRFFSAPRMTITRLTSKDVPRQMSQAVIDKIQCMELILTNYESLRNGQLNYGAVDFEVVVLDEAQRIKTPGTLVTNAAKALKGVFKIAMTGTPVENSLLDLWCIMDYCVPGLMGNARLFSRRYQAPLKQETTDLELLGKEIHGKMGGYFLRRMKTDVAKDLPKKEVVTAKQQMPIPQEKVYRQVISDYQHGLQPNMLATINLLRNVSEHPYLISGLEQYDEEELLSSSARLQATITFVDRIRERDEKVIVFALFKESQRMLQRIFYARYGIIAKIINGDTPPTSANVNSGRLTRQGSINHFQAAAGFNIIIMSPIAAGMGLNVTAANHVIHYSRHWNPAKEQQATDRAYRIGQDKDVYVYYPMAVCHGLRTFDETLDELLRRKTELATSTIIPTDKAIVKEEELCNLLLRTPK